MAQTGAWGGGPPVNPSPALPWGNQTAVSSGDVCLNMQQQQPAPTRGQTLMGQPWGGSSSQLPLHAGQASGPAPAQPQGDQPWILRGAIPFGRIAGIQIRWHVLLPVLVALQSFWGFSISPTYGLLMLTLYGPILLATVLIHELGHALTAKRLGIASEDILIWPLGGLAFIAHSQSAKKDLLIAIAGPLTHIPMAIFWLVALSLSVESFSVSSTGNIIVDADSYNFWSVLCAGALTMQFVLFIFNLCVPAYPLDGGRVFCDVMCLVGVGRNKAGYASGLISGLIGVGMFAWGVAGSVQSGGIQTTVFIGAWIAKEAFTVLQMTRKGTLAEHPMFATYGH